MLNITINGLDDGPMEYDQLSGAVMLFKHEDGVGRIVCGDLSVMDLVLMIKMLYTGKDEVTKKLILARALASLASGLEPDDIVEMSDVKDPEKNPFAAFMKGMKEHE